MVRREVRREVGREVRREVGGEVRPPASSSALRYEVRSKICFIPGDANGDTIKSFLVCREIYKPRIKVRNTRIKN
jgi:hypothetical protein